MTRDATVPAVPARPGRRRWIALVVLCVGQLMIALDATVVNVALPSIQRELHFSQASLAWVINGYLLTFGGLLLLAGRVGDLLGRAQVFLTGLAAFVLSSVLCGLAPTAGVLVLARFVQGAGAAMVAAMVLGIITPMFPRPRERTTALSIFAFVAVGGQTLGLVLGGTLTQALSWHWIFFINVPFGAAALLLASRLLPRLPGLGIRAGADLLGALLVTMAPVLAVYGLINAGDHGWGSTTTLVSLPGSVILALAFVQVERRVATPLVPLAIFRHHGLVTSTTIRTLFPMGGFSFQFLGVLYLQKVLGYTPLQTGLAFLPGSVTTGLISLTMLPWLIRRFGMRALILTGLVGITAGLLWFAPVPVHGSFWLNVLPAMLLTGSGFGIVFMPSVAIAMSDVDHSETGLASGLTNVAPQIGASIAVAALATLSAARTNHLLARHEAERVALSAGYRLGLIVGVGCTAVALVVAAILLRSRQPTAAPSSAEAIETSALISH
ncbi:MAG: MFS transporter [Acidimicrobiaceae bacterium]|nr:MFS transporter [Acidimicrobiaceae bacterium]